MKRSECRQEEAVARATRAGRLPDALAKHVAECAACREAAETARWMQALALSADAATAVSGHGVLPDAGAVWRGAALAKEQHKVEKIRTAIESAQIAFAAAAPIGLGSWVVWNWYGIEATAEQFLLSVWPQLSVATYALASLAPAALMLVALALGYPLLASE